MNFPIFLAFGAAFAAVFLAYKYLKWQAVIWLGGLLFCTAGGALLLDRITDIVDTISVNESSATGAPLFMLGPDISILGTGWPYIFIAFLCGIVLTITGLIKKSKQPPSAIADPVGNENLSENAYIEQDLKDRIADVQEQIGDPAARGNDDATSIGGPVPARGATAPMGYETEVRDAYETLGTDFVRSTIERLKAGIKSALKKLAEIKSETDKQPYVNIASGYYSETATRVNSAPLNSMRAEVAETTKRRKEFISRLNLKPAEQPEWPSKRPSLQNLLGYGLLAAFIEFLVSWYFLKDQLGSESAITAAALAVAIIVLFALLGSISFRFTRRGQSPLLRIAAGTWYLALLFGVFCGLGLLLRYRDGSSKESYVVQTMDAILNSYGSMLNDLSGLTLFLINLVALIFFYWKFLLYFDRFYGYSHVDEPYRAANQKWGSLFDENEEKIHAALDVASDKADANSQDANRNLAMLQEKTATLESIQAIIKPAYVQQLRRAYLDDIKKYRDSNREHRNHTVQPAPEYFNQDAGFCTLEEHFTADHGVEKFLSEYKETIEQAPEVQQHIQQAGLEWQQARPDLHDKWSQDFQRKVNDTGQ